MPFSVSIGSIRFSGGQDVQLEAGQVLVIVGPNNSGKSTALREVTEHMVARHSPMRHRYAGVVTSDVVVEKSGSPGEFVEWLETISPGEKLHGGRVFKGLGFEPMTADGAAQSWTHGQLRMGCFVRLLDVQNRMSAVAGVPAIDSNTSAPTHALQLLLSDEGLEKRLSDLFVRAFGTELTLDRGAAGRLPLYCGRRPEPGAGEDRVSPAYRRQLAQMTLLEKQGDGMRSFIGCVLDATIAHHPIVLVDEPEAFLHPPQAKLLGQILGGAAGPLRQIVVATHSSDLLRGLLDTAASLKIVRLTREGGVNRVSELDAITLSELWSDPLLRFSNALDGLFHETVVVCEADSDSRFYSAILDAAQPVAEVNRGPSRAPEAMFTSCGGKSKIADVVRALKRTGVNVRVISDFDVLRDEKDLRAIVEAIGGNWSVVEPHWRKVKAALEQARPPLKTHEAKARIDKVFEALAGEEFPRSAVEAIGAIIKRPSLWDDAKRSGIAAVPSGEPSASAKALLGELAALGLFVVEVGELERFLPEVPGHGPPWVLAALSRDLRDAPELESARTFMKRVVPNP